MFPHCFGHGDDRQGLRESWGLLAVKVQGVFLEAECKLDALSSIDLGEKRPLTVGESLLWTELCGARFSA